MSEGLLYGLHEGDQTIPEFTPGRRCATARPRGRCAPGGALFEELGHLLFEPLMFPHLRQHKSEESHLRLRSWVWFFLRRLGFKGPAQMTVAVGTVRHGPRETWKPGELRRSLALLQNAARQGAGRVHSDHIKTMVVRIGR